MPKYKIVTGKRTYELVAKSITAACVEVQSMRVDDDTPIKDIFRWGKRWHVWVKVGAH